MIDRIYSKLFISFFIQAFVLSITGMVDCAVVGRWCGADGLTSMQLAMPVFLVLTVPSFIGANGISIVISREIGQGRKNNAVAAFSTAVIASGFIGIVFTAVGILAPSAVTRCLIGFNEETELVELVNLYLQPVLIGAVPIILLSIFNAAAALEGKTVLISVVSFLMLPLDIVYDLIAVFVFNAGVKGVAYASSLTYLSAFMIMLVFITGRRSMFTIDPGMFSPELLRDVIVSGIPHGIDILCDTIRPIFINMCMLAFGTLTGIAALTIQDSIHYFPEAVCIAAGSAMMTLSAVFFGEKDRSSLMYIRKNTFWKMAASACALSGFLWIAAPVCVKLFTDNAEVMDLAVTAFRWYAAGVPFAAVNHMIIGYLNGIEKIKLSSAYIVIGNLLVPMLCIFSLGKTFGLIGIYAAFGLNELIMTLIGIIFMVVAGRLRSSVMDPLGQYMSSGIMALDMNIRNEQDVIDASEEVRRFCIQNGISYRLSYHAALCIEELASNTIKHGFTASRKNHLSIRVAVDKDSIILRSRDDCNQFDITERYSILDTDDKMSCLGIRLIYGVSDRVDYTSALDLNNICIHIMKREGEQHVTNRKYTI